MASKPNYLIKFPSNIENSSLEKKVLKRAYSKPTKQFSQKFAGQLVELEPNQIIDEALLKDIESRMAFHRFSWLTESTSEIEYGWVAKFWTYWATKHGVNREGLAWQPYTTSERLINLVRFFCHNGFPDPSEETIGILSKHGQHIFDNLEYFGEKQTGNHFVNNGRALYLAGDLLKNEIWMDIGSRIIINHSKNIFDPSGTLREGSAHYHLLITSWYLECWLVAREQSRVEERDLLEIATMALSAASIFDMPGGIPLIGDVSPDCTPGYLYCLLNGELSGWLYKQKTNNQHRIKRLINHSMEATKTGISEYCIRRDFGPWSIIWTKSKDGWQPYPGHSHQDFGGFELHLNKERVFVDIGRGSYGVHGEIGKLATSHNVLTIDGQPAYPENRAYYNKEFRKKITGSPPTWEIKENEFSLFSESFSRIKGVISWTRHYYLGKDKVIIVDKVNGTGIHKIDRYLNTLWVPKNIDNKIYCGPIKLVGDESVQFFKAKYWHSYGQSYIANVIKFSAFKELPYKGILYIYKN